MKKMIGIGFVFFAGCILLSYQGKGEEIEAHLSDLKVVEVKGEVNKPGVYEAAWEANLEDILSLAGGISEEGSIDALNLGQVPAHKSVIVIPKKKKDTCISLNGATLEELDSLPRCWS